MSSNLPPYVAPVAPVSARAPLTTDDATKGYATGQNWMALGQAFSLLSATAGAARWQINTAASALPGDAAATPLAVYGMRRLVAAYGTGAAIDVQFTSGGTTTTLNFLQSGLIDYATLDALSASAAAVPRVVKWYDQSGAGYHVTGAFATAPTLAQSVVIGNARSLLFDSVIDGTTSQRFLTIPTGLTSNGTATSVVALSAFRDTLVATGIIQLNNASYNQFLGYSGLANFFYMGYVTSWSITQKPPLTPFVSGYSSGSSATRVWIDEATTSFSYTGNYALAGGTIGISSGISGSDGYLELAGLVIYARAITATDQKNVTSSFHQTFATAPQARDVLVYDGDSITDGYGSSLMLNYTRQSLFFLPSSYKVYNIGAFGQTSANRLSTYSGYAATFYNSATKNNIISLFIGTNDIAGSTTPAATYANVASYVAAAHATGFRVIVVTMLPRTGVSETLRTAYNALILANTAGADAIADFGNDPTMGVAGTNTNTTLYFDGTHPTSLGYGYLAPIIAKAVLSLTQ